MEQYNESNFVRKEACPQCGSGDNLARYDDGHAHCFTNGCNHREHANGTPSDHGSGKKEKKPISEALRPYFDGEITDLAVRKITEETCRRYGYRVAKVETRDGIKTAQLAPYYKDGQIVGAKVRFPGKDFTTWGDFKNATFFGSQLQDKGKILVVTEGEIDAMSVSQAQGNKYAAVSVPGGAAGAAKAFKANLEYFNGFETVVIFFDMDEVGQAAAKECAELLQPGKAKIAHITGAKDANDLLQQGRVSDIITAIWQAKDFRPDGIVTVADVREKALKPPEMGLPWFLSGLTKATYGRRTGELYCVGAGTGVGKTDWLTQQIEYDLNTLHEPVSVIFLEQSPAETLQRIAGKMDGKLYHIPDGQSTTEELSAAIDKIEQSAKLFMYDSWGASEWNVIKNKIRYLAHSENVRLFYIDHLTALAAMQDDEKKALEQIMAEMAGLCKELDIIIHVVSHLSTPEGGKSHEEGARVTIKNFKGARAIGFWCHFMFGIERDQQDEDQRNQSLFRILKDRNTGRSTGLTFPLYYDPETGRIDEAPVISEF
jgi:twinkle protein